MLTVVLALLAALSNASASVLQRRAAADEPEGGTGLRQDARWLLRVLRRPAWVAGAGLLALSTVFQAWALSLGGLALVQPLLATELLFTLAVGALVFRRRPAPRTCLAFLALAAGLAVFLAAASPTAGRSTAHGGRWLPTALAVTVVTAGLALTARTVRGAPRAALLGLASAVCFAATAALLKETTGKLGDGLGALMSTWPPYATLVVGTAAFLLLQYALRAGTLAASQPALTLGDALTSVALGWVLFGERIALGARVAPALMGVLLMGAGSLGLARALPTAGGWDTGAAGRKGAPPAGPRHRGGPDTGGAPDREEHDL
ncbi:DMT family transporter [Streptomyces sp. NPDC002734]|uniref:DMT family transporter n=1 Tax=Streptomyces sp. NPDC002734 TaxID=3154426 RepID=UPI00331FD998